VVERVGEGALRAQHGMVKVVVHAATTVVVGAPPAVHVLCSCRGEGERRGSGESEGETERGLGRPLIEEQGPDHAARRWVAAALHGGHAPRHTASSRAFPRAGGGQRCGQLGIYFWASSGWFGPWALKQSCSFPDALKLIFWVLSY